MSPSRAEHRDALADAIVWHDLECGAYTADLPLWRTLAAKHGDPILDIGAGTGRVALELARHGHQVTALDRDELLVDELRRRGGELELEAVVADAREFRLGRRFELIVVPMQTIQLLGDASERARMLARVREHLRPGGFVELAISERLDLFDTQSGSGLPMPDILEREGVVYCSQPTAVRELSDGHVLERRRERIDHDGNRSVTLDRVPIAKLTARGLEEEALRAGLLPAGRHVIAPTSDHVGSVVVALHG